MPREALPTTHQPLGDYDLLELIAEGGMCAVYRARHRTTGQLVAVKILPASTAKNALLLRRFQQEFRAASSLDHPNIVRALDFCGTARTPFLVMEYVEGESLGQKLERDGRLAEEEAIRLTVQLCRGLHYAHGRGVIHRDVKPDNIILTPRGQARLTDLGLVKELMAEEDLTRSGGGLGTPHFMAPEQFRDAKNVDARSDVYALGATLYMMVTGVLPFENLSPMEAWLKKMQRDLPPPRALVPGLSERTDRAICRALAAGREARPASCLELERELTGQRASRRADRQIWYVNYVGSDGRRHSLTQTTEEIRDRVAAGWLQNIREAQVSRRSDGPFEPIERFPEFHGLMGPTAPDEPPPLGEPLPLPEELPDPSASSPPVAAELVSWLILGGAALTALLFGYFLFR